MKTTKSERLAWFLNEGRLEQRLTWEGLADRAGFSSNHLRKIRRGEYLPSDLTARALEIALGWEFGSIAAIIDGGSPVAEAKPKRDATDDQIDAIYEQSKRTGEPVEDIIAEMSRRIHGL